MRAPCFHCGADIPEGAHFSLEVRGEQKLVCCAGCRAVAALIEAQGLSRFYDFRSAPSGKPPADAGAAAWSVCDRPEVARRLVRTLADGSSELTVHVGGVTCAACTWLIDRGLRALPGVAEAAVNPVSAEATVRFDPRTTRASAILAALASFGFEPRVQYAGRGRADGTRAELKRLAVAGLGSMQVMTLSFALYAGAFSEMEPVYASYLVLVSMLIATPVVLYAGAPIFRSAWRDLTHRRLGMDVPVALAVAAALGASVLNALRGAGEVYFDSATMFLFFLTLGRFFEARARHSAGGVFDALADLTPLAATRRRGAALERVGTIELDVGDRVLVAPGEALPADGRLVSAQGSFDEALLSGESLGRVRTRGDDVLGGSLNAGSTPVEIEVTRLGADSYVERIGGLLRRALSDRPRYLAVADRWAAWFVAGLLAITACAGAAWWLVAPERAFDVVLALLVVTCPCALSLAAPTAFAVALGRFARLGLLLSSTRVLERLRDVDLWLFDKTGTLTEGRLGVTRVTTSGGAGVGSLDPTPPATGPRRRIQESDAESRRDFVLGVAAALEAGIEHPVARALRTQATPAAIAEGVEYRAGYGVTGRVDGVEYTLGSARYVGALGERASNAVYLATARGLVATIELADRLRPSARAAVATLARTADVMLVSGDEPAAVTHVAAEVGIARTLAQHAPEDKLRVLRAAQAQGRVVAAVGDGVNDAPLLAAADVSIAMVAGSRLAQAAADVVFTGDDLRVLARLPNLAAATRRVVRENLAWAAGYNLIAVPLAAAGVLAPWMAAVGMSVSSLIVVGNALRLHRAFARGVRPPLARLPAAAPVVERRAA